MKVNVSSPVFSYRVRREICISSMILTLLASTVSAAQIDETDPDPVTVQNDLKSTEEAKKNSVTDEGKHREATELTPMVVTGSRKGKPYQDETSTAGTKFPVEVTRVPQSIQVITDTSIKDQGDITIGEIMKQVPGANIQGSRFTEFPSIRIRGFKAQQTRNGIRQFFFDGVDFSAVSHIQRVEVLKGPGSTLFGQNGDGGGIINIVTKRPYEGFGANVEFTRGGWDGFNGDITMGQWDFNAPLTPDGALKARFTGQVERTNAFIDFQNLDRENFGLALTYDNGGPVRAFINAEYLHRASLPNPGLPTIGTITNSGVGQVRFDTFLGEPFFDDLESESPLVQAWLDIDVAENWTVSPRFQYHQFNTTLDEVFLGPVSVDPTNRQIDVTRFGRSNFAENDSGYIGQIDIIGTLETGPFKHEILFSGEYMNSQLGGSWANRVDLPTIDALNPRYLETIPETGSRILRFGGNWQTWALSFQDLMSITSKFDLLGGVRQSWVNGNRTIVSGINTKTNQPITTFQVGGVFHATDAVHLFAGFGESFNVLDAFGFGGADGTVFKLGETDQVEAGIKFDFPWGLTGTAAFFHILRTNIRTPDRANPGFDVQTGEVRSFGGDSELSYQIMDQWYIQGGYAYVDTNITESNSGTRGNRLENTPTHQANLWTHYKFDSGVLRNLTFSAGMNFVGDRWLDNANTAKLPNYTTVDLGTSYTYKNVKAELFANNVLDKRYFVANDFGLTVVPGEPRSIMGRVSLHY